MLTEVTAARRTREIEVDAPRRTEAEVALLLFRRLIATALHEAKKTRDGLPTNTALLERAWFEEHTPLESHAYLTSFAHCCHMLALNESEERARALKEISRQWHKALVDWGRKRWQEKLEMIETLKAEDNPAWAARRAIQSELPLTELSP